MTENLLAPRDEVLAVYSMAQELTTLGHDPVTTWLQWRDFKEEFKRSETAPPIIAKIAGAIDLQERHPTLLVTLHYDLYKDAVPTLLEYMARTEIRKQVTVVVGGVEESGLGNHLTSQTQAGGVMGANLAYTGSRDFQSKLHSALRRGDIILATLDANLGSSDLARSPFLNTPAMVRTGLFRIARAAGAIVQPVLFDSARGKLFAGPSSDARSYRTNELAATSMHWLGLHVSQRPHAWLHWPYALHFLDMKFSANGIDADHSSPWEYIFCDEPGALAFHVQTGRLYGLDSTNVSELSKNAMSDR